jgi:MYXO-CTERM domain-containing protein
MTTLRTIGLRNLLLTGALLLTSGTGAHAAFMSLTATLTGAQETPPNSSPGTGSAAFILDDINMTLISAVTFSGLTSPTVLDDANTSAQIYMSPPGVAGSIIHPLPTAPIGVTSGSFTDIWTGLTAADIAALETGDTYINIHTAAFPGGEIRGQILPSISIPEPSSLVLGATAALAGLGLAWHRRRQRSRA